MGEVTRVLTCGLATVDVVQTVLAPPGNNQKIAASAATVEGGGPALNAAVTAALLGASSVLVSAVGDGPLAGIVRSDLDRYAVELADCAAPGYDPPLSTVLVSESTGDRAVVSHNALAATAYLPLHDNVLDGVGAALVDGHHLPLCHEVADRARRRGVPVVLDGGSWKPGLENLLPGVDMAVVSAGFHTPSGDGLDAILRYGPSFAARSNGAGAVSWRARDGSSGSIDPPKVAVVDTLGAGDVLHGAIATGLAEHGWTDPVALLEYGVRVASRSVGYAGARGWARRGQPASGLAAG
jgi:sugar/nucleoside kinase (ribokinase family)